MIRALWYVVRAINVSNHIRYHNTCQTSWTNIKQFTLNNKLHHNKERLWWKKSVITVKRESSARTIATPQAATDFLCLHFDRLSRPMRSLGGWGGAWGSHGKARWPTSGKSTWRISTNVCLKKGGQEALVPLASSPICMAHLIRNGSSRKPSLQYWNTWQLTTRCQGVTAQENEAGQNEIPKQ